MIARKDKSKSFFLSFLTLKFLMFLFYSFFVLNFKNIYMSEEWPIWSDVKNKINKKSKKKYNLIMLGDSRAKSALIPNIIQDKKVLSLAIGGATPIEGYFTLKKYLENNPKPEFIIISYAPFHFVIQDSFWDRTVKYNFLKYNEYNEIIRISRNLELNAETLGKENKIIDYFIYTPKYFRDFYSGIYHRRWIKNKNKMRKLALSNGHIFYGKNNSSDGLFFEARGDQLVFEPSALINYYFEKLLDLANEEEIKTVYYSMPFNNTSYSTINREFIDNHNEYLDKKSLKSNLFILNYLNKLPNSDFGDASHLYNGSNKVTRDIIKKIQQIKSY